MTSWYDDYLASMAVVNARPTPAVGACLTLGPTTFITWHKTGTMLTEMLRKILLEHVNVVCGRYFTATSSRRRGFIRRPYTMGRATQSKGPISTSRVGKDRMAFHFCLARVRWQCDHHHIQKFGGGAFARPRLRAARAIFPGGELLQVPPVREGVRRPLAAPRVQRDQEQERGRRRAVRRRLCGEEPAPAHAIRSREAGWARFTFCAPACARPPARGLEPRLDKTALGWSASSPRSQRTTSASYS